MSSIECLNTGLIYRNPKPHLRSVHAYFPSVVVLCEDEMLATLVLGSAFESVDFHVHLARSTDGGETWYLPSVTGMNNLGTTFNSIHGMTCIRNNANNPQGWIGIGEFTVTGSHGTCLYSLTIPSYT